MRNAIWMFATITAMGLGTAGAATQAAKTTYSGTERKSHPVSGRHYRQANPVRVPTAAPAPASDDSYVERTIAAPSQKTGTNKSQSPTKSLSRADRRQA